MSRPLNPDILRLCRLLDRAYDELSDLLSRDEVQEFNSTVERFAHALLVDDPDAQSDAWLTALRSLRKFEAFRIVNDGRRKFFDPAVELPPQTAQEVVPILIACVKATRRKTKPERSRKEKD